MDGVRHSGRIRARGGGVTGELPLTEAVRAEIMAFPPQHLAGLPIATRFTLELPGFAHPIVWTTERVCGPRAGIWFDADEVEAIAIAVQAERLWPADLKAFCLRKMHDPSVRVTPSLALDGAQAEAGPAWSFARVLAWLDLELAGIEIATPGSSLPRHEPAAA